MYGFYPHLYEKISAFYKLKKKKHYVHNIFTNTYTINLGGKLLMILI